MSRSQSWQQLSLQQFFGNCDWDGASFVKLQPLKAHLQESQLFAEPGLLLEDNQLFSGERWLGLTLGQFFAQANWHGQPAEDRPSFRPIRPETNLWAFSVVDFWRNVPWESLPEVGVFDPIEIPLKLGSETSTSSLTDLSDLF